MHKLALLALLLTVGCGENKEAPAEAPKKVEIADKGDWKKTAVRRLDDKIGEVGFSVEVPEGWAKDKEADPASTIVWRAGGNPFTAPSVMIQLDSVPPATLEDAISSAMPAADDLVPRKETVEGGFLVTKHNPKKTLIYVHVFRKQGAKALTCGASQGSDEPMADLDAVRVWLEGLCLSLKIAP